jgi:small basic protein (TIGR04137 family)
MLAQWRLSQKLSKEKVLTMSRHPSFGKSTKGAKKRNVLKRFERVDVLKKLGRWNEAEAKRVTGLPKTPISA